MPDLDVLYLSHNRLEYTRLSFGLLHRNTDWSLVNRLIVYDDDSVDGTEEWLREAAARVPVPELYFETTRFKSPPITMNDYLSRAESDLFAKIDNDIAVPPRWLEAMLAVMERHADLELLGMEAGRTGPPRPRAGTKNRQWEATTHIGGVGLMRTRAFHSRPAIPARGRFGFTEWQKRHDPVRGWVTPDLRVCQLDRVPYPSYRSLAHHYVSMGWARAWPAMDTLQPYWYDWLPEEVPACV